MSILTNHASGQERRLKCLSTEEYAQWYLTASERAKNWLSDMQFQATPGQHISIPAADGHYAYSIAIIDQADTVWRIAQLATTLPPGTYKLESQVSPETLRGLALGWALEAYEFVGYKSHKVRDSRRLLIEDTKLLHEINREVEAITLVRDLINTPAEDMGPVHLAAVAEKMAVTHGAKIDFIRGDELLACNYPSIHAVGRASAREPLLIDMRWGDKDNPLVAILGKGVCFDSGGLDIKDASWMRLMKKDMGGAAHALGLAKRIMDEALALRIRVLIPAVENALSGNAYHPGDVIKTRQGTTLEVDNTDAEGRVVLCDALAAAVEESPDLVVDFATLTSAARTALGSELPAFFTRDNRLARDFEAIADAVDDPVWRLPLFERYRYQLDSQIADIANRSSGLGDAIVAALFLATFVPTHIDWLHLDLMGWNQIHRPGRPYGGEAMGLRAVYTYLKHRFGVVGENFP